MRPLSFMAALPRRQLSCCAVVVLLLTVVTATSPTTTSPRRQPAATPAHDVLAKLPVSFEPAGHDRFVSRGSGYSLSLTGSEAAIRVDAGTFRLRPAGPTADPTAALVPDRPLAGTVNRLTGDDPAGWSTGLSTYARVTAQQVWPGIDMVWHGDQRRLEHDMVVAPGTDPAVVALDVDGASSIELESGGDLAIALAGGTARLARPVLYQNVGGSRRDVAGAFTLSGPTRIGFRVGAYDATLPLVIDPTLVTSTFLGGMGNDSGYAIAVDTQGNSYVTGSTESADFPTATPAQPALVNAAAGPTSDVFVSKLSPDGSRLVWSTYLGGQSRDTGFAIAVGTEGAVYVAGVTESADFPLIRSAQAAYGGGPSDAFVTKIAADGKGVEWSTVVGGSQADRARGLALDAGGNAYLTGSTSSVDFPAVSPQQPGPFRPDDLDAFLVKVPATGAGFTYATRLGGSNDDRGLAVAVDSQGSAYVTGDTLSPGFPTARPIQAASGGGAGGVAGSFPDAFVTKYNPTGSALVYSTFLGGSDVDQGTSIALDAQGAAYVAGNTNSPNFPTTTPLQATKGSEADAFVTKIDPAGSALVYSTYLGGSGADGANAVTVDRAGSAHVVGSTRSANWVTAKPVQTTLGGGDDAFVVKLDSTGRGPLFSTFLGGTEAESGTGVALDARGGVHVVGLTGSSDFRTEKPVQGSQPPAGGDAFVASLDLVDVVAPAPAGPAAPAASSPSPSSSGHDRRVLALGIITVVLLLAAVLQTLFLRRRAPATAVSRPRPVPSPSAKSGLTVLDGAGGGARRGSPAAKAAAAAKSTRSPKARGGPKGGPAKKAAAGQKAGDRRPPTRPKDGTGPTPAVPPTGAADVTAAEVAADVTAGATDVEATDLAESGGPPTMAVSLPAPRARPQTPAVAQLLEEDLWGPEPSIDPEAQPPAPEAPPGPDVLDAPEWAPFDTGSTPTVGAAPEPASEPAHAPVIPPVPAEELSFWDLFPEDLPPARATPFPVEDLLADHLPLPEDPQSAAKKLLSPEADDSTVARDPAPMVPAGPGDVPDAEPSTGRPPRPPETEIVIAELLDGPPAAGRRPSAEPEWSPPAPDDDFLIDDLLAHDAGPPRSPGRATPKDDHGPAQAGPESGDDGADAAGLNRGNDEQSRIAADRARRRRSRRGGRRQPPGSG